MLKYKIPQIVTLIHIKEDLLATERKIITEIPLSFG